MRRTIPILIAGLLLASGCLIKTLKVPAEDHFVQTATISDRCQKDPACDDDMKEDLAAMAKQACLIDAIVKGDKPERCDGDGE